MRAWNTPTNVRKAARLFTICETSRGVKRYGAGHFPTFCTMSVMMPGHFGRFAPFFCTMSVMMPGHFGRFAPPFASLAARFVVLRA